MIFYLAMSSDNKTKIVGTQADARAINPEFEQIDIPVDKAGLMTWIQQMLDETLNAMDEASHDVPVAVEPPKPKPGPHPKIAEILTALEVYEFIETIDEKRLRDIEHSISTRRGQLAAEAAKAADVQAD